VRELLNVLERATISAADGALHLPLGDGAVAAPVRTGTATLRVSVAVPALEGPSFIEAGRAGPSAPPPILGEHQMRNQERENLRRALESCGGKIYGRDGAAALLGLKPTTLASRLKRLQLRP
jgi:transcriptional regulator with GAF, ATPase, and Fis domain